MSECMCLAHQRERAMQAEIDALAAENNENKQIIDWVADALDGRALPKEADGYLIPQAVADLRAAQQQLEDTIPSVIKTLKGFVGGLACGSSRLTINQKP